MSQAVANAMSTATPEQVLASIVAGINSGDLESVMPLFESEAAFATQPGSLAHGAPGISEALTGFTSMTDERGGRSSPAPPSAAPAVLAPPPARVAVPRASG